MQDAPPATKIVIHSLSSPDLAAGLMNGRIDLAFLRRERNTPGIVYRTLREEPLIVLMAADHRVTARDAIRPQDIAAERLFGVAADKSPALCAVVDAYGATHGLDLTPDFDVDSLSMAMSRAVSTGGITLMPLYARNLAPPIVTTRPREGERPKIDLSPGYDAASTSPQLGATVAKIGEMTTALD